MVSRRRAWDNSLMTDAYNQLAEWLTQIEASCSPAGFHGQIAGLWCRLAELPEDLALDEVERGGPAWQELAGFAAGVRDSLADAQCGFEPVLPPDTAPLPLRIEALADFSEGLLFGIGAAGQLQREAVSEEVQELMRDLAEICKVAVEGDEEGGEEDYAEIVEYLRVAAQTLYVELHPQAD